MRKREVGFTIVELLIVIVVIGILAAITVVAYTGIQNRALNSQTTSALQGWVKAAHMYQAENGVMPPGWTCLGEGYPYGESGTDTSGAQCRKDSSASFTVTPSFDTAMRPFIGNSLPSPAMVTVSRPDGTWRRGLMYAYSGGAGNVTYIMAAYKGDVTCPDIGGTVSVTKQDWQGDTLCTYVLEER